MRLLFGCLLFAFASAAVVIGMGVFGLGAMKRMGEVREQASLHGITPADAGPAFLDRVWTTDLEARLQTLAALPSGEILALRALDGGYRLGPHGALIEELDWPEKAYLAHVFPQEGALAVLTSSVVTRWRWSFQGYEALREDLAAWDASGRELWRFSLDPGQASRIDPFFGDFDGDGVLEIACPLKKSIAVLDGGGRRVRLLPRRAVSSRFDVGDFDQDGADELILCDALGGCTILDPLTGETSDFELGGETDELRATLDADPPAVLETGSRAGRRILRAVTLDGALLFEDELEFHPRGVARSSLLRADLDGDGEEAWVVAEGDGAIRLYSHDGFRRGVHYTGVRIADLIRVRRPGGDLLVAATHRGVAAWGRPADPARRID